MANLEESVVIYVIVAFCTTSCFAAVFIQPDATHPDHHGKCYDKITKRALLPGKEYKPKGICAVMTCDYEKSLVEVHTCPFMEAPGCIELPANSKLSYPKCCPQYLCTDEHGEEIILDATSL